MAQAATKDAKKNQLLGQPPNDRSSAKFEQQTEDLSTRRTRSADRTFKLQQFGQYQYLDLTSLGSDPQNNLLANVSASRLLALIAAADFIFVSRPADRNYVAGLLLQVDRVIDCPERVMQIVTTEELLSSLEKFQSNSIPPFPRVFLPQGMHAVRPHPLVQSCDRFLQINPGNLRVDFVMPGDDLRSIGISLRLNPESTTAAELGRETLFRVSLLKADDLQTIRTKTVQRWTKQLRIHANHRQNLVFELSPWNRVRGGEKLSFEVAISPEISARFLFGFTCVGQVQPKLALCFYTGRTPSAREVIRLARRAWSMICSGDYQRFLRALKSRSSQLIKQLWKQPKK
ncbi:hypothetical protein JNK13_09420 [bacterium]|nr:hypothetical protein [bacterium]